MKEEEERQLEEKKKQEEQNEECILCHESRNDPVNHPYGIIGHALQSSLYVRAF